MKLRRDRHAASWRRLLAALLVSTCLLLPIAAGGAGPVQELSWQPQGPGPNTRGQVEKIEGREVTGAINAVAAHPGNPKIVYVGTANGGVWKTENALDERPIWVQQTDDQESLSIGALEFDPSDSSHQTLVAGIGRFSSLENAGGLLTGLLRTSNGGGRWEVLDGGGALRGLNVSGVAPRGAIIAITVTTTSDPNKTGVWRSKDGGSSWTRVSGAPGTGLPNGDAPCLEGDRELRERLYTTVSGSGLFRSDDAGATWKKVSNAAMDLLLRRADNVKLSAGPRDSLFAAIDKAGRLAGVFHTADGGERWAEMDLPSTREGGIHPGGQGRIHLSLAADPVDRNIVYIGGDRQPAHFIGGEESDPPIFPNSIGAKDFSGRLFRGDVSRPAGRQWIHLTHSRELGAKGGGTRRGSAPHADSRGMALAHGILLEVDDGGIYKRTRPRTNDGDWFSMNGNLAVAEFHAVAWDDHCHLVIGGAQDTGTPEQPRRSNVKWRSVSTGDGGVVAVDTLTRPGRSVRYSSHYDLGDFRRQVYDRECELQSEDYPPLKVLDDGPPLEPQFYTPLKLNTVTPTRLILGGINGVYESYDQGDSLKLIAPDVTVNGSEKRISLIGALQGPNAIAYGAKGNPDMLYLGSAESVLVRTGPSPSPLTESTYSAGTVLGIAIDRNDPGTAFVVSPSRVSRTPDAGRTWTDMTGDLPRLVHGDLLSIAYKSEGEGGALFVGTSSGVFMAQADAFSHWQRLGRGLPNAAVYEVEYSDADGVLLAGTLGRGAWTLKLPGIVKVAAHGGRQSRRAVLSSATGGQRSGQLANGAQKQTSTSPPAVPDAAGRSPFQLAPGIIVDSGRGRLYTMGPTGGVEAVELASGRVLWRKQDAAKPIGLVDGSVIGQGAPGVEASELKIVELDPLTGATTRVHREMLPPPVRVSSEPGMSSFVAEASPDDGDAVVSWRFERRLRQGIAPGTAPRIRTATEDAATPAALETHSGTFRLNLTTGMVKHDGQAAPPRPVPVASPSSLERLAMPTELRFASADGRATAISRPLGDAAAEGYLLTVYDEKTQQPLGELRSRVSVVPFFVEDGMVIYESNPYSRRTAKGMTGVPRRVVAVNQQGKEVWSVPVRATVYRGPVPP